MCCIACTYMRLGYEKPKNKNQNGKEIQIEREREYYQEWFATAIVQRKFSTAATKVKFESKKNKNKNKKPPRFNRPTQCSVDLLFHIHNSDIQSCTSAHCSRIYILTAQTNNTIDRARAIWWCSCSRTTSVSEVFE